MKKKICFCVYALFLFIAMPGFSQSGLAVSSGSDVFIKSGTPVSVDGLVLTPSVNFTISGTNNITRNTVATNTGSNPYIWRVFRFSSAVSSFSGAVGIFYSDDELKGLHEDSLILYAYDAGGGWKRYTSNVSRDATHNLVTTTGLLNLTLNELTLTRRPAALTAPSIVFDNIGKTYGDGNFNLLATSNSSGPITYAVVSGTGAMVNPDGAVTITGAGSVIIKATQAANGGYAAGEETATLTISPAPNAISFTTPGTKTYGDAPFDLDASAASGGAISYRVVSGPATISGSMLTITGAGDVTVKASSDATTNHTAAADETVTFTINKAVATISFSGLTATYDGSPKAATVTTSPAGLSGVAIQYDGSISAPVNAGSYPVSATLTNDNYTLPSDNDPATATLEIAKAANSIDFGLLSLKTYGDADFTLDATASSGLAVTYTATGAATVSGNTVHITGAGSAIITAHQAGNGNYAAAADVMQNLTIGKATVAVSVSGFTGTYDGAAHGASGTATGVGGADLTSLLYFGSSFTNCPGGMADWSFAGNANYKEASGSVAVTINKATPTMTLTVGDAVTYDGLAHFVQSATVSGVGGVSLGNAAVVYTQGTADVTAPINAGDYTVTASYAGDGNYIGAADQTGTLTINKANATIVITPYSGTYDGNAHTATGTVTGVIGANLNNLLYFDASYINVPGGATTWSFYGDINYNGQSGTTTVTIAKAQPTVTITVGGPYTYDGTAHPVLSVTVSGVGGAALGNAAVTYAPIVNGTTGTATSMAPVKAGSYAVVASFSGNNNYTAAPNTSTTLTIGKAALTVVAGNRSRQYSDPNPALGGTVTGVVNGDGLTVSYTTTANATAAPGSYTITPVLSDPNNKLSNYAVALTNGTLTVTQEDARVTYTGSLFASTSGATKSTATVTLSATVQDISATPDAGTDSNPGDIRKARVKFVNRDNGADISGWLTPGLVKAGDSKTGTVTFNWNVNIGTQPSSSYTVGIVADNGYYTRNSITDNTVVTVSKPMSDFITGGGFLKLQSSSGLKAGDAASKANFGFHVKYNKSRRSLQGNINIIVRRTERDGLVHVYQIKGNYMTSMAVNTSRTRTHPYPTAVFDGKASIQDITNPMAVVSVDGGASLHVTMTDKGEPGSGDGIAITVWKNSGGLWFSSNWDGTKTAEQILAGGNLKVSTDCSFSSGTVTTSTTRTNGVEMNAALTERTDAKFGLTAFPNPSATQFNLRLESTNTTDKISLRVVDVYGRTLDVLNNLSGGQTIRLGSRYSPGNYFAEIQQGRDRKQVTLLKVAY